MLVLASTSPRRKELLALGGWDFQILPADINEDPQSGEAPIDYVRRMAESKAKEAAKHVPEEAVVLAADTTVVDTNAEGEQEILGKPADAAEAEIMLRRLRGRTHQVMTAVAVLRKADGRLLSDVCITDVPMRAYTDEEMMVYIESGDPLDKAGGYAIQHPGFHPAENLNGCYANVVGLPLCHVTRLLRAFGIEPKQDVARACQQELGYMCPIFEEVLGSEPPSVK
jgi:MAF protein